MSSHIVLPPAPVSSVWMSSQYLSQGETQVSCHSEGGDGLSQYSWSLNGVQLDSTENDSSSVTLKPGESGYVVCTVSNNVSEASSGQNISERGEKKLILILRVTIHDTSSAS